MKAAETLAKQRFRASCETTRRFFEERADEIAHACREMASRFDRGGRLLALGERAAASDAHHVAVEFVHPVLVGKRALPALAFTEPLHADESGWADRLRPFLRSEDIVLAIAHGPSSRAVSRAIIEAQRRGALTIVLTGGMEAPAVDASRVFQVPSDDALVVQEVHETLYHVLWELVHVFLRSPSPMEQRKAVDCSADETHCSVCGDEALPGVVLALDGQTRSAVVAMPGQSEQRTVALDLVSDAHVGDTVLVHQGFAIAAVDTPPSDHTRALYPFLYDVDREQSSGEEVLAEVRASTLAKCSEVIQLRESLLTEYDALMWQCADDAARRIGDGGKLIAFGNGGSATDAEDAAADCGYVAQPHWRPITALALTSEVAVLSAIANDVGFDNVFSRQVIAFGQSGDVALGISTSGNSPNVVTGLREAKSRGLLTIALSGADGGEISRSGIADYCFVARSTHVPRIQEGQATVWHTLLDMIQKRLA